MWEGTRYINSFFASSDWKLTGYSPLAHFYICKTLNNFEMLFNFVFMYNQQQRMVCSPCKYSPWALKEHVDVFCAKLILIRYWFSSPFSNCKL